MAVKFDLPFTQTSHLIAFICVLLLAVAWSWNFELSKGEIAADLVRLTHLASFAIWLGVQVWVTFIAGVTMFRHLPRRMFGFIQSKLFPKYFLLGTILSSVTALSYLVVHPFSAWGYQEKVQGSTLFASLVMVLANLLFFEPQTTKITSKKHVFEKELQAGEECGKVEEDKLKILRQNPEYNALDKKFVWLHTLASIANLGALAAQGIHLWHLACQLKSI